MKKLHLLATNDPDTSYQYACQPAHSVVAEYLELADAVTVQFEHCLNLLSQLSITSADETKHLAVTLNPNGAIADVWMQPGIKSLGSEVISQRLNEALQKATATLDDAKSDIGEYHSRELAALQARNDYLNTMIGAGRLDPAPPTPRPALAARLPTETPAVTGSNPAHTIFVTTRNGYATNITVTADALTSTTVELAAKIVEVARFSYARDQAIRADRLVAQAVAAGDNEIECRRYLHRITNLRLINVDHKLQYESSHC